MKNATLIYIFTALLLGLVLTSAANAQNYYSVQHHQPTPILDTLPDGTVINLSATPFDRITPNKGKVKSAPKTDKKAFSPHGNSQANPARTARLKSTNLIKSLNDQTSSFYAEKIDSVVRYDTHLVPQYDSIQIETTEYNRDANGNVVESITKKIDEQSQGWINIQKIIYEPDITTGKLLSRIYYVWESGDSQWIEDIKNEYDYDVNGNQTLWLKYSWNRLTDEWFLIKKSETTYDENNRRLNYKYFDVEKDGVGVVSSKYEYTYNDKGAVILYQYYNDWDTDLNTWLNQYKQESTYNQDGKRTSYSTLDLNMASSEWEYNYKYEYNYLEDGSIEETRYDSWNSDTKEFDSQYYARYKYDRLYENDKLVQEVKLSWRYDNWEYDWKRVCAYDQWGNVILNELYDPYWGDYSEPKERWIKEFTESGRIIKSEYYVRDDEDYEYYELKGVYYNTYQRDNADRILSFTEYKWDEEKNEWLVDNSFKHSYPNTKKEVVDTYKYDVSGYSASYIKGDMIKLDYDTAIGRYTGADEDGWGKWQFTYNEYLKINEVTCLVDFQEDEKIKCYYNATGQDTAWYIYNGENNDWELRRTITFAYEILNNGQLKITEHWNDDYDDERYDYYYEDGRKIIEVTRWFDDSKKEWTLRDSSIYNYNTMGQLTSAESVLGEYLWKGECTLTNDSLTINTYYKETLNDDWQLEYKDICIVDPDIGVNQFQQIPKVVTDGGLEWIYEDFIFLGYGKILEYISYDEEDLAEGRLNIDYKEKWHYSEASILSGDAVISGYIFNTEQGDMKSVSAANDTHGIPSEGVEISLCARDDDFVLASETTDSEGFYQFLGVPNGNFYLKVVLEGYVQNSTHEIQVTDYLTVFEGKNFNISDGTIATNMDETSAYRINIYPNPTSGKLTIEADSPVHSIAVYNMTGIKLAEFNQTSSIDLSGLSKGFYLIQVSTESENRMERILVE